MTYVIMALWNIEIKSSSTLIFDRKYRSEKILLEGNFEKGHINLQHEKGAPEYYEYIGH